MAACCHRRQAAVRRSAVRRFVVRTRAPAATSRLRLTLRVPPRSEPAPRRPIAPRGCGPCATTPRLLQLPAGLGLTDEVPDEGPTTCPTDFAPCPCRVRPLGHGKGGAPEESLSCSRDRFYAASTALPRRRRTAHPVRGGAEGVSGRVSDLPACPRTGRRRRQSAAGPARSRTRAPAGSSAVRAGLGHYLDGRRQQVRLSAPRPAGAGRGGLARSLRRGRTGPRTGRTYSGPPPWIVSRPVSAGCSGRTGGVPNRPSRSASAPTGCCSRRGST